MIITILTIREIEDEDYDSWVNAVNETGMGLDGKKLKEKKQLTYMDDFRRSRVTTIFRILDPEEIGERKQEISKRKKTIKKKKT